MRWTNRLPDVQALLPTRIPLRLRVFFRGVFVLLALAAVALAGFVLREEKELGLKAYREGFAKTKEQIVSRLRHPTGQLALLNPDTRGAAVTPLHPVVLPFSAIDFDDRAKVQQAVEMAGCGVQYGDGATLCVAIGSNPLAGGFIYAVGSFATGELVPKPPGARDLGTAHRVRVEVAMRGQIWRWLAPYEGSPDATGAQRGRLTGFAEDADGTLALKPVRDFRGWLWQDARCVDGQTGDDCPRRAFYSVRLPIELFRDELQTKRSAIVWPPADLARILVHLQVLAPSGATLFDSNQPDATPPFGLADLQPLLLPGETLRLARAGAQGDTELALLQGSEVTGAVEPSGWDRFTAQLIRRLKVDGYEQPLVAQDTIATPLGRYDLTLTGDVRSIDRTLGRVAARVGWFVVAMLAAIALAWLAIELRIVRRITLLTRRAAAVRHGVQSLNKGGAQLDPALPGELNPLRGRAGFSRPWGHEGREIRLDVADLRGSDELGLLAGTLAELLERVNDDVRREQIRTAQEREQWHAVGHEIMSPLQSLLALHAREDDPSQRYLRRMQQAIRVLYGQASPTEAFEATTLPVNALDIDEFLRHVADNAPHAGIGEVRYSGAGEPCIVRGDEYALEDVVTHVLRNADRYRPAGTPIDIQLLPDDDGGAVVTIHNPGEPIPEELIGRIFEYGVSDAAGEAGADPAHRGQGLFVARTYMAKMGGTIEARNEPGGGVSFVLRLARA